jgi:hypothetical protein
MKHVKTLLILLLGGASLLIATSIKAQTSGPLADFNKIRISGSVDVELIQAGRHSYYLVNNNDEKTGVEITSENGILNIKGKNTAEENNIKIYFKALEELECSGISSVKINDTLHTERMQIKGTGATQIKMNMKVNQLKVYADGATDILLTGVAETFSVQASGASKIKAGGLQAKEVSASSDGASSIKIQAIRRLSANASGVSNIKYIGSPENKNISVSGMAQINGLTENHEFATNAENENESDKDTVHVKIGRKKFIIIDGKKDFEFEEEEEEEEDKESYQRTNPSKRRDMKAVWGGIETGINGLVTPDLNFTMNNGYTDLNTQFGRSWFIGINLPELDGHIIRNKLAITTGFGIKWSWMEFGSNNIMKPDSNKLAFVDSGNKLSENELNTFNLTVPLLLKLAPGNKKKAHKGFHIAAGVIVNYVATTRLKTVTADSGYERTTHYKTDFNLNPFRLDGTLRFGYDRLRLFANYTLTPYFDSAKAPDIRQFSAGITLVGF